MPRQTRRRGTMPKTLAQLVRQLMDRGQSRREAMAHARKIVAEVDRFVVDRLGRMKPEAPGPSILDIDRRGSQAEGGEVMRKDEAQARRTFSRRLNRGVDQAIKHICEALVKIGHDPCDAVLRARLRELVKGFYTDLAERDRWKNPDPIVGRTTEAVLQLVVSVPPNRPPLSAEQRDLLSISVQLGLYAAVVALGESLNRAARFMLTQKKRESRKRRTKGGA